MIEWWIDIPNLQTVNLPDSFQYVLSTSITSIDMSNNEWIDVSTIFTSILPFTLNDIESLDSNITSIQIPNYSINDLNYTIFNFSRFNLLEELIIGDNCFIYVSEFKIDGLNELKSLEIGSNSFTKAISTFELKNLPKLESIKIGEIGSTSNNFRYSSFVIKGIIDVVINNEQIFHIWIPLN